MICESVTLLRICIASSCLYVDKKKMVLLKIGTLNLQRSSRNLNQNTTNVIFVDINVVLD